MINNCMKKTGPKPKELTLGEIEGIPVGRDKIIVPPQQVYELAALGCRDIEIANFFGVNENSLRYNFKAELTKGKEDLKITLRRAMLKNATVNMNAALQIFLAKNILGMSDSPLDSDANAPLPWTEDDTVAVEETDEDEISSSE